jgi:transcriptional regulator with XRE-family HTH domain
MSLELSIRMGTTFRGDKLRACRAFHNNTQKELAAILNIGCKELEALESGLGMILLLDIEFLEELGEYSGQPWEVFFNDEPLVLKDS